MVQLEPQELPVHKALLLTPVPLVPRALLVQLVQQAQEPLASLDQLDPLVPHQQ